MRERLEINVEPLSPALGAEISGFDLRKPLCTDAVSTIHALWMKHQVLFFRNQQLTPHQHLAFAKNFGAFHVHPAAPYAHDNPALMVIHTDANSRRNNGSGWHSDVSSDDEPPLGSILHLHKTPLNGGDTLFASIYEAFTTLNQPMKLFLRSLTAHHASDYGGYYGDHKPQRESPQAVHPVVRTHPITQCEALFVNAGFTKRIVELSYNESASLLKFLFEHIQNPKFQCRFAWKPNSIAMWDNRCVQHMAIWDYYPQTRSGLRVTL